MKGGAGLILGVIVLLAIAVLAVPFAIDTFLATSTTGWSNSQISAFALIPLGAALAVLIAVLVGLGGLGRGGRRR